MEDNTLNDTESFAVDDWDNPETVQWYNIKTGRSKDKGVVITHDGNFKVCPFLFLMNSVINCYNDHLSVTRQQDYHQGNSCPLHLLTKEENWM